MSEKYREWRQLLAAFILSMWVMVVINIVNRNVSGVVLFSYLMWVGVGPWLAIVIYEKRLAKRKWKE